MHTAETQGINTIFIDQWPDYNISENIYYAGIKIFCS